MEILTPGFRRISSDAGSPRADGLLLVTGRADIAAAAGSLGLECRHVDPAAQDDAQVRSELTRRGDRYDTLVVVWGDGVPVDRLTYHQAVRFGRTCLALLDAVRELERHVHVIGLSGADDVLPSMLDGMAASAALESRMTYTAARVHSPLSDDMLARSISACVQNPGKRLTLSGNEMSLLDYSPSDMAASPAGLFGENDNLVLIGGAGGIGRELCRYLHRGYGSNVFVLGRSRPGHAARQALRTAGATSYFSVQADNPEALADVFGHIRRGFGGVRAVFNLAGVLDDSLLRNLTPERLEKVLRPKVGTTLGLAALPARHRPELVVNFSSLTSVVGNVGQAAYGAANAFVDRLTPLFPDWYSINWGLWDTHGMQMPDGSGLRAMRPQQACDVLMAAIAGGARRLVVFDGRAELGGGRSEPAAAPPAPPASAERKAGHPGLAARTRQWLRELVTRHSGLKRLGDEDNLLNHGLDSVGSIRISRDIESQLGLGDSLRLSRAIIFEYPTVGSLADYLAENAAPWLESFLGRAEPAPESGVPESGVPESGVTASPAAEVASGPAERVAAPRVSPAPVPGSSYRPNDVAIIGMAGEFPNGDTIEEFWHSLLRGEDAVTVIPGERWDWRDHYAVSPDEPNKAYGRHGGFLRHALEFDPVFFNITPVEAASMDPQERRFLQSAYHALEDSGYFTDPHHDVGVFAAAMYGHYQDLDAADQVISSSFAAIANRVSYAFDLHGPSVALDTMCSGSLTALHLAANSIRAGDCRVALAGGVNIMVHPGKYRLLSEGKFLSATGYCHSFGVEADGYVPGEGVGVVVLKSVSEAMRDGDRIHAVIRATAINAGGRSAGFTVPSERAQHLVIASALAKAGVEPSEMTYVEAHGTGTQLGDPIELQALTRTYGGADQGECYLGAVKSNIGHLESAAAMAGLVKVVKQLSHRTLAPTLHCELENPNLDIDRSRFVLVKEPRPWPRGKSPTRFAGLSSFGAGGANAHAIVQEFVAPAEPEAGPTLASYLIALSARDEASLSRRKEQLLDAVQAAPDMSLYGLSYTLCRARQHFRARCVYWVRSTGQLARLLRGDRTASDSPPPDGTWAHAASEYRNGGTPDFAALLPVKRLLDLPLYPFSAQRYLARSLEPRSLEPRSLEPRSLEPRRAATSGTVHTDAASALLMTPAWRRQESNGHRIPCVIALTERGRKLPALPHPARLISVVPGAELLIGPERIEVPPDDAAAVGKVLDHLTGTLRLDHLYWADLWRDWTVDSALSFAKALQACRTPSSILSLTGEDERAEAYAVGGLFRGLAEENPHIRATQARGSSAGALPGGGWQSLLDELGAQRPAAEVSWADGTRRLRGLEEIRLLDRRRLNSGGVYLLTGGLGQVGRAVAGHLTERYRARVIAVGRSPLTPGQQEWIGSRDGLSYERADITSHEQTRDLVDRVCERFGGLDGVIHSAGVVKDALVQNKTADDAKSVIAPKIWGTRNLDRSTAHLGLDFFCVFSSISSVMGNVGQSDYIAANRFLDEFAAERARLVDSGERSGHTLSINWPLWLDPEDDTRQQYRALAEYLRAEFGLEPLTSRRGAELFAQLLDGVPDSCHQILACVGNPVKMREAMLLAPEETGPAREDEAPIPPAPPSRASVRDISSMLVQVVRDQTGLQPQDIDVDATWGDLGYSSVMVQRLAASLGSEFGVETPANALFKYNTIKSVAGYLREHGVGTAAAGGTGTAGPAGDKSVAPVPSTTRRERQPATADGDRYAIVGMSGIMPGAPDLDGFWRLLIENRSAIRRVDRWKGDRYYAGTIDGYDLFDNGFFGLSARESMLMDPQHRLFLQAGYNAVLDAGYAPSALGDVGIFAGVQFSEYQAALRSGTDWSHPYAVTGNAHTMLANRVSHLLDFTGPSQTVDTACSSGLVALNRGVLSLRARECGLAVVGAVSVLVDPASSDAAAGLGVLSPDFRCATFDKDANGYVRAEGVGCVAVKRLEDAIRDGDSIYAVIESVAENHNGRSTSLTAPNPQAQVALLNRAYPPDLAGRVTSIETHGTGTSLGDPIEIGALQTAFGQLAPDRLPGSITLGAVKPNVGHLEPAAGMAGLLKMLLCLKHRRLPGNINFQRINPMIELAGSPFRLLLGNEDWDAPHPLVAGISSFGFGGSNAHVVVSEAPRRPRPDRAPRSHWLVTLSARSRESLVRMRAALLGWLRTAEADLADIAYTLNSGRDHVEYRMAWIASSTADLIEQVEAARPDQVGKCDRNRFTAHSIELPAPSRPGLYEVLKSIRDQYLRGEEFGWNTMFAAEQCRRLNMPGYAFEPKSFWFE